MHSYTHKTPLAYTYLHIYTLYPNTSAGSRDGCRAVAWQSIVLSAEGAVRSKQGEKGKVSQFELFQSQNLVCTYPYLYLIMYACA